LPGGPPRKKKKLGLEKNLRWWRTRKTARFRMPQAKRGEGFSPADSGSATAKMKGAIETDMSGEKRNPD